MIAPKFDHVVNPESCLFTAAHRFVARNCRQLLHRCFKTGVVDYFSNVVVQVVGGEGHQIETKSHTLSFNASAVPALFSEHWNSEHWNGMKQGFVLTARSAVSYEEFGFRVTKNIVLRLPWKHMDVARNLTQHWRNRKQQTYQDYVFISICEV